MYSVKCTLTSAMLTGIEVIAINTYVYMYDEYSFPLFCVQIFRNHLHLPFLPKMSWSSMICRLKGELKYRGLCNYSYNNAFVFKVISSTRSPPFVYCYIIYVLCTGKYHEFVGQ